MLPRKTGPRLRLEKHLLMRLSVWFTGPINHLSRKNPKIEVWWSRMRLRGLSPRIARIPWTSTENQPGVWEVYTSSHIVSLGYRHWNEFKWRTEDSQGRVTGNPWLQRWWSPAWLLQAWPLPRAQGLGPPGPRDRESFSGPGTECNLLCWAVN